MFSCTIIIGDGSGRSNYERVHEQGNGVSALLLETVKTSAQVTLGYQYRKRSRLNSAFGLYSILPLASDFLVFADGNRDYLVQHRHPQRLKEHEVGLQLTEVEHD